MINTDKALQQALANYERTIQTKVFVNGKEEPITTGITRCEITETGFSGTSFTIGEFNTNSLKLTIYSDEITEENVLTVYQSTKVGDEYVDTLMGTFYISKIERNDRNNQITITAYDISYKLNETYISNIETMPTTAKAIMDDISTQYGISYKGLNVGSYQINAIYDCSVKEMIGWIAQLQCSNVKINREGIMEFYWYIDVDYTIDRTLQKLNGFKKNSDKEVAVDGITCTTRINGEEVSYVEGTGVFNNVSISNPYMTQDILKPIYNKIVGFHYLPCTIDYRGNPTLEVGDVVQVVDSDGESYKVLLSEHNLVLTSMSGSIDCKWENEVSTTSSSYSPTEGKINAVYEFVERFFAKHAEIEELYTKYAQIDFANIGEAAIEHLFADYGIINNLVIEDGQVTGQLNAVTINGDLINTGTLKTDRLVVRGTDGNYYQLNLDGMGVTVQVVEEDQINGKAIVAQSVTADKIYVSDLSAFRATIGGFRITNDSLYSGVKSSVDNTTNGIYLDSKGQLNIGDTTNHLKYYFAGEDEGWKLDVSASSISINIGDLTKTLEEAINDVSDSVKDLKNHIHIDNDSFAITNGNSTTRFDSNGVKVSINGGSETNITANGIETTKVKADTFQFGRYVLVEEPNGSGSIAWLEE